MIALGADRHGEPDCRGTRWTSWPNLRRTAWWTQTDTLSRGHSGSFHYQGPRLCVDLAEHLELAFVPQALDEFGVVGVVIRLDEERASLTLSISLMPGWYLSPPDQGDRDGRVVQAALKLVLEPIFEADLQAGLLRLPAKRRVQDAMPRSITSSPVATAGCYGDIEAALTPSHTPL